MRSDSPGPLGGHPDPSSGSGLRYLSLSSSLLLSSSLSLPLSLSLSSLSLSLSLLSLSSSLSPFSTAFLLPSTLGSSPEPPSTSISFTPSFSTPFPPSATLSPYLFTLLFLASLLPILHFLNAILLPSISTRPCCLPLTSHRISRLLFLSRFKKLIFFLLVLPGTAAAAARRRALLLLVPTAGSIRV
ncbi:unnamed protein product [Closterium sp. Naga37s-1]|nr:unnamed protein product [Closterium sp. Naga37s-1]